MLVINSKTYATDYAIKKLKKAIYLFETWDICINKLSIAINALLPILDDGWRAECCINEREDVTIMTETEGEEEKEKKRAVSMCEDWDKWVNNKYPI